MYEYIEACWVTDGYVVQDCSQYIFIFKQLHFLASG